MVKEGYIRRETSGEQALTEEEVRKLLSVVNNLSDEVMLHVAIEGGLRRSDIVRVEISNIDFEEGWLRFHEGKKGDRIHEIAIGPSLSILLKKYLDTFGDNKTKWLFPSPGDKGEHISDRNAWNVLNRNLDKAGITRRPFHSLRATCAKLLLNNGWSKAEVARHLNDTIGVIERHYETPSKDEMKEAATKRPMFE